MFDFTGGNPAYAQGQTGYRDEVGYVYDLNGENSFAANVPRYVDHSYATGSSQHAAGLLCEQQWAQSVADPEDLRSTGSNWSALEGFAFENRNKAAPDGSTNGTVVYSTAAGETGRRQTLTGFGSANKVVSVGVFASGQAESETIQWAGIRLRLLDGTTSATCYFNVVTGTVGTTAGGAQDPVMINVGEHGGETWYYCGFSVDLGSGSTAPVLDFLLAEDDNDPSSPSIFGEGIVFWGAIAADCPFLPQYSDIGISDSGGANVGESFDAAAYGSGNTIGTFPPEDTVLGAVLLDFTPLADVADLGAHSTNNIVPLFNTTFGGLIYVNTSNQLAAQLREGDVAVEKAFTSYPAMTGFTRKRLVFNYDGSTCKVYEGGAEVASTSADGLQWGSHLGLSEYALKTGSEGGVVWHHLGVYANQLSPYAAAALSNIPA